MTTAVKSRKIDVLIPDRLIQVRCKGRAEDKMAVTEEEFHSFVHWMQSACGKGFPIHDLMKALIFEVYTRRDPAYFEKYIPVTLKSVDTRVNGDEEKWLVYRAEFEAILPIDGQEVPVRFTLTDREKNPPIEVATNLQRILELSINMAVNGLLTPLEMIAEYTNFTQYVNV